jgi:hypothetical protein
VKVGLSVTLRDRIRSADMVSEFKNGRNKNTQLTITAENLNSIGQMIDNFFAKNYKVFDCPIVSYRISFSFLHRLSNLNLIEACPSDDPGFLDYFLNGAHSLANERKMNSDSLLSPQVILNDFQEKNFKLYILSILGEKGKMYMLNYNVLTFYEKLLILLNSTDCLTWNPMSPPSNTIDLVASKTTGFSRRPSPALTKNPGR